MNFLSIKHFFCQILKGLKMLIRRVSLKRFNGVKEKMAIKTFIAIYILLRIEVFYDIKSAKYLVNLTNCAVYDISLSYQEITFTNCFPSTS